MKVVLLQLPLQSHDFFFSHENIPLAAAYLQGIARQRGIDAELLPKPLVSYGNDEAILHSIVDAQPDLVGLSCYLWNVERSLFLAGQIKRYLPSCIVVLGGPEITSQNRFLLDHGHFDIGVVGEGEEIWDQLLEYFPNVPDLPGLLRRGEDGNWHENDRSSSPPKLGRWPSPFLSGLLDSHINGVLWLETVRGCPYRCAYCSYPKHSPRLREFPFDRVFREVEQACKKGLKEIVFLDPCFLRRPKLEALLDGLITHNPDRRLRFHAEARAEAIHHQLAEKMARAGFAQLEVGLQSVNREALRNVHRSFHPQRFLSGIRCLREEGIEAMVDVMAGLPADTLSDICRTLDWVMAHEAYDYLMLYPLSLIAGTELQQRTSELGLSAMPDPPYLLTRSPTLTASEMNQAFHYYEASMEEEITPLEIPPSFKVLWSSPALSKGLRYRVDWNHPQEIESLCRSGIPTAYSITVGMTREVLRESRIWGPVLKEHLERNPFTLLSVEVPPDALPEELDPLWRLARSRSHPLDRDYTVTHSPYRSLMVLSYSRGLLWKWPDPRESQPLTLHDGQKVSFRAVCKVVTQGQEIPEWFREHIRQRYSSPPEIERWQPAED